MGTFKLPHFSAADTLQKIDRGRLISFLDPYRDFFAKRGVILPALASSTPVPYDAIIRVLMSPDEDTPHELIDALHYVDGMSTTEEMQALLTAAKAAGYVLDDRQDVSPADIAVQVWLLAPNLLERTHAERYLTHPRSFEYFQSNEESFQGAVAPPPAVLEAIERDLNDWFVKNRRGRTARVFAFERPDGLWFLVRHGQPFKREESFQGTEPGSVAYRPLKYDVVVYDPGLVELRINAELKGEKTLYCETFGRHLFGNENFFPGGIKYTLAPLREVGEAALMCADVDGLEWIRLRELHYRWGGTFGYYEIVRATDLFASFRSRHTSIPDFPELVKAVFQVKFQGAERARLVAVKPPAIAQYDRDQDNGPIEDWLAKRGFLNVETADNDQALDPLLART